MRHKVVVDTNVLVSALLSSVGSCAKILDLIIAGQLVLCTHYEILREYEQVLLRPKFKFDRQLVCDLVGLLENMSILVIPTRSKRNFVDESDRIFYDTALFCGALLITGNIKHFPADKRIFLPTAFIDWLESSK